MDSTDFTFDVMPNTLKPFGPVLKENLDIVRLVFDCSCWLGDEVAGTLVSSVMYPVIGDLGAVPVPPGYA